MMNLLKQKLEKEISQSLEALPQLLQSNVAAVWNVIADKVDNIELLKDGAVNELTHVLGCSEFIQKQAVLHVNTAITGCSLSLTEMLQLPEGYQLELSQAMGKAKDEAAVLALLRRTRNQRMLLIAWADILGGEVEQVILSLSNLADCYIRVCCDFAYKKLCARYGVPRDQQGIEQVLIVMGMGKLGAYELNFSSDIDLIYCYPCAGETDGERNISNEEFFLRMCRLLTKLLDKQTADGFVFRVDTRLRPFGNSGALALNFDAMEAYYHSSAREWERYAMIKARLITGAEVDKEYLSSFIKAFVYRRYLDYGVFDSIRVMKKQIDEQLRKKANANNIKLGLGGIREIEFIGQAFQLVRGGRDISLQQRSIISLLGLLAEKGILADKACQELTGDYRYLRRLENAIQQIADQQTHLLPSDEIGQARLVLAMDMQDWPGLGEQVSQVMQRVHGYFNELVASTAPEQSNEPESFDWLRASVEELTEYFEGEGLSDCHTLATTVHEFCLSYSVRRAQTKGREYLTLLLTSFFKYLSDKPDQVKVAAAFIQILEKIATRTVYLVLLVENEEVLQQLVKLTLASPWVVSQIAQSPILLDELIDPRRLYTPNGFNELAADLDEIISRVENDDEEQLMDALRLFKQANTLKVAAADLTEAIPLMVVSDKLTAIADVVINQAVSVSWQLMTKKFGTPKGAEGSQVSGFAVIGFGKLGGFELGFGSDLDLVFLHKDYEDDERTVGENNIQLGVFYSRLVRRVISLLTSRTQSGPLYEIDLRLRPNGNSGLLVSSVAAFERYQMEHAWTWEQQALIRARAVTGGNNTTIAFNRIRQSALNRERDRSKTQKDIVEMRQKMRQKLLKEKKALFDLKQGNGGIVDIEFIVQFGVLINAFKSKELICQTDNVRLIECLQKIGFFTPDQGRILSTAYQSYREASHHAALAERKPLVDSETFKLQAKAVSEIWDYFFKTK